MSTSSKTKTSTRLPAVAQRAGLRTIGWREWVALPEFRLPKVKAKVDTGARSSCLDALNVEVLRDRRPPIVRFAVAHEVDGKTHRVWCECPLIDERWVTSSDGHREYRPVVATTMRLLDETWTIEVTLTDRAVMGFRMLLGREALRRRFVVDPSRSFVALRAARSKRRRSAIRKAKTE